MKTLFLTAEDLKTGDLPYFNWARCTISWATPELGKETSNGNKLFPKEDSYGSNDSGAGRAGFLMLGFPFPVNGNVPNKIPFLVKFPDTFV